MDNFHDEISLPNLFEAGVKKFTPLISYGRLLQLHGYAKSHGSIVSYFEAFSVEGGLEYPRVDKNMMGFPESITTSMELVEFADSEMNEVANWITEEKHTFGFVAFIESNEV